MVMGFDRPFAHPNSSYNEPVLPPDVEPDEGELVQVCFSVNWLPYVLGALSQLMLQTTWRGTSEEILTAQGRATNLTGLFVTPVCEVDTVGTPYWDDEDGADADDEAPVDMQPWYGEIVIIDDRLTFQENIEVWVVAALVAYAATPAAAIAFVPIARNFVISYKKHDLGGIIRAFVDGALVGEADSYSAEGGVGEMTIVMPEPTMGFLEAEDAPVLWLEMAEEYNPAVTGAPNIQLFRKRLTESEVIPPNQRYSADCDCVQFSPDNGVTWVDMPSLDPRHSDAFRYPPLTGEDARCDAAANMVKWIKDFLDDVTEALGEAAEAFQIANIALAFFNLITGGSSTLLELIVGLGGALTEVGYTALLAAFDSDTYDALLCCFYCHLASDGSVSPELLIGIEDQVTSDLNTTAALVVNLILELQGEVGVSNAGTIGGETGDCSACECQWSLTFDFTIDEQGWYTTLWLDGYPAGYYNTGCCFQSTLDHAGGHEVLPIAIDINMPTGSQLRSFTAAGFEGGFTAILWGGAYYNTYPPTVTNDVSAGVNTLTAYLVANVGTACRFYTITISGTGDTPTF